MTEQTNARGPPPASSTKGKLLGLKQPPPKKPVGRPRKAPPPTPWPEPRDHTEAAIGEFFHQQVKESEERLKRLPKVKQRRKPPPDRPTLVEELFAAENYDQARLDNPHVRPDDIVRALCVQFKERLSPADRLEYEQRFAEEEYPLWDQDWDQYLQDPTEDVIVDQQPEKKNKKQAKK